MVTIPSYHWFILLPLRRRRKRPNRLIGTPKLECSLPTDAGRRNFEVRAKNLSSLASSLGSTQAYCGSGGQSLQRWWHNALYGTTTWWISLGSTEGSMGFLGPLPLILHSFVKTGLSVGISEMFSWLAAELSPFLLRYLGAGGRRPCSRKIRITQFWGPTNTTPTMKRKILHGKKNKRNQQDKCYQEILQQKKIHLIWNF